MIVGSLAPMFYELGIEANYPISEIVTVGAMSTLYNVWPTLFLLVFLIPQVGKNFQSLCVHVILYRRLSFWSAVVFFIYFLLKGKSWMTWCYFGSVIVCLCLLVKFKEKYYRLTVDRSPLDHPDSDTQSQAFLVESTEQVSSSQTARDS